MAIGSSLILFVGGLHLAGTLGDHPGRADLRIASWIQAGIGGFALWLTVMMRQRAAERRPASAPLPAPGPRRRIVRLARTAAPRVRARRRERPLGGAPGRPVIAEPDMPLSTLGQIASLVDQTQVPGQHGKLPPSPLGKLRYPS